MLVVVLMLCFAGMALPLASVLLPAGLDWLYFASMGLTALLVDVYKRQRHGKDRRGRGAPHGRCDRPQLFVSHLLSLIHI